MKVWRIVILFLTFIMIPVGCQKRHDTEDEEKLVTEIENHVKDEDIENADDTVRQEEESEKNAINVYSQNSDWEYYLNLGANYLILAIGNEGNLVDGGNTPVYESIDGEKEIVNLQYNVALVVNTNMIENNRAMLENPDFWIPVELPNLNCTGYVRASQVRIESIKVKNCTEKYIRNIVIENAVRYLGTPFVNHGDSMEKGIDCSKYVQQLYKLVGVEVADTSKPIRDAAYKKTTDESLAEPGDIVYYDVEKTGHVAIYLGNGFIINSAGHDGKIYPEGGVRISCIQYHDREEYLFCKILQ